MLALWNPKALSMLVWKAQLVGAVEGGTLDGDCQVEVGDETED